MRKLYFKNIVFVNVFCLLSILSIGQNTKNTAPQLNAIKFVEIDRVARAGNSNQLINCGFPDESSSTDDLYYRLIQVDFDGTFEVLKTIHANCNKTENFEITPYPNLFDGKILFLNSSKTLKNSAIYFYDAIGRLVYQTECNEINSHTEIKIDKHLKSGAYYLKLSSENELNKQISLIVK